MKRVRVVVGWREGLHLRCASKLMRVAQGFRSTILLRCRGKVADLRSIMGVITLCATMGTAIDIEATGDDEQDAVQAVEQVFSSRSE